MFIVHTSVQLIQEKKSSIIMTEAYPESQNDQKWYYINSAAAMKSFSIPRITKSTVNEETNCVRLLMNF
jgi:hypothetical protein